MLRSTKKYDFNKFRAISVDEKKQSKLYTNAWAVFKLKLYVFLNALNWIDYHSINSLHWLTGRFH